MDFENNSLNTIRGTCKTKFVHKATPALYKTIKIPDSVMLAKP